MKLRVKPGAFIPFITGTLAIMLLILGDIGCSSSRNAQISKPGELPPPPAEYADDTIPVRTPEGAPAIYGVRSGKIILQYTGNRAGTRTLQFDQYGMRVRIEEYARPFPPGSSGPRDTMISVRVPEWFYRLDLSTGRASIIHNEAQPVERFLQMDSDQQVTLGEELLGELNMTRMADTTIQGYECRTYVQELPGVVVTQWIWRGIILREHFSAPMENVEYTAEPVLVALDIDFDEKTFTPLEGFPIREVSNPEDLYQLDQK